MRLTYKNTVLHFIALVLELLIADPPRVNCDVLSFTNGGDGEIEVVLHRNKHTSIISLNEEPIVIKTCKIRNVFRHHRECGEICNFGL